jgi:hypothetical protein
MKVSRKVLGWPRRCKLAHAFRWEYSYKRLKLAHRLGQLGAFLTKGTLTALCPVYREAGISKELCRSAQMTSPPMARRREGAAAAAAVVGGAPGRARRARR